MPTDSSYEVGLRGRLGNVLVTGGTGSFGKAMIRMLKALNAASSIRVLSRDELKQDDMQRDNPDVEFILGDVRDPYAVERAMRGIHTVFHAAALKQVPRCENNVWEAVQTNVVGTHNVVEAVKRNPTVCRMVTVSTDKAVAPINAYGMTKGLAERITTHAQFFEKNHGKTFLCVRYGNVLGSRGSVVPLFRKQGEAGQDLTVTVPDMTRFMLLLDDAIRFVIDRTLDAIGGEVFVPELKSVRMGDLAEWMAEMYGVGVKEIGIRPGEKIHEVLVSEEEVYRTKRIVLPPDTGYKGLTTRNSFFVVLPPGHEGDMVYELYWNEWRDRIKREDLDRAVSSADYVYLDRDYWMSVLEMV